MKNLYKVILFVTLFCFINYGFDYLYECKILTQTIDYRIENELYSYMDSLNTDTLDYLIIGDSQIQSGINPNKLKGTAYNYCGGGETFILSYYKLKHFLKTKKVKNVIISINMPTFSDYRAKVVFAKKYWIKFSGVQDLTDIGFFYKGNNYFKNWTQVKYFSYMSNYYNIYTYFDGEGEHTDLSRGQPFVDSDTTGLTQNIEIRVASQLKDKIILDSLVVNYFDNFLKLCSDNNVKVIAVKLPVTQLFLDHSIRYMDITEFYNKLDNIMSKHSPNITLLDYLYAYTNTYDMFFDGDHLNAKGSSEFTKALNDSLIDLKLKNLVN